MMMQLKKKRSEELSLKKNIKLDKIARNRSSQASSCSSFAGQNFNYDRDEGKLNGLQE